MKGTHPASVHVRAVLKGDRGGILVHGAVQTIQIGVGGVRARHACAEKLTEGRKARGEEGRVPMLWI